MSIRKYCMALVPVVLVMAGCAAGGQGAGFVAAPVSTSTPPLIMGAGMPAGSGEPWLAGSAVAASAVTAPLHAIACAGSAGVGGLFYGLFFPGDSSDDIKAWIGQNCAGPYLVTPAEIARPAQPFPVHGLRTPRTGTLPVEEAVQAAATRR